MNICSRPLLTSILLTVACAVPASGAEPKTELKDAIQKLRDQPNYSWTIKQKTEGSESASRRDGGMEGKAEKTGLVLVKTSAGDNSYEVAFKGEKVVVNYNEDWIEPSELPIESSRVEERLKALKITPIDQATALAESSKDLKKESAEYTASMTPEEALSAFKKLGRRAAEATEAKGTVKFWLKEGRLDKYEFKVQGKITTGTDKKEVEITRTTTVEIKDVGSTKISLPEGARNRLG